eukprot:TRINITY_DN432_c0_g1_i12.p1 TRINITY_DN432_c0_g1~~TRINITY_DN432_c0_g1_i12.p1  ORF type:complete len:1099 (-),score=434.44 TRINITY_DN432_c0_g1_i12:135-3431(-)
MIKVECWDWDDRGFHDLIGECQLTMRDLNKKSPQFPLINPAKVKNILYKGSGVLYLDSIKPLEKPHYLPISPYTISVDCNNLEAKDVFTSDPFLVVVGHPHPSVSQPFNPNPWTTSPFESAKTKEKKGDVSAIHKHKRHGEVIYRSEYYPSCKKCTFKPFELDLYVCGGLDAPLQFELWDFDKDGGHDFIGSFDTTLRELVAQPGFGFAVDNEEKKGNMTYRGSGNANVICTPAKPYEQDKKLPFAVNLQFSAEGLTKTGLLTNPDTFFAIIACPYDKWNLTEVYRSEIVNNSTHPEWKKFTLDVRACGGMDSPMYLVVYDSNKSVSKEVGKVKLSLRELSFCSNNAVFHLKNRSKKGTLLYKHSGIVMVRFAESVVDASKMIPPVSNSVHYPPVDRPYTTNHAQPKTAIVAYQGSSQAQPVGQPPLSHTGSQAHFAPAPQGGQYPSQPAQPAPQGYLGSPTSSTRAFHPKKKKKKKKKNLPSAQEIRTNTMDLSIFDDLEKELAAFAPKPTENQNKSLSNPSNKLSSAINSKSSPELWIPKVSTQRGRADPNPPASSQQEQFLRGQLQESNQRESTLRKELASIRSELDDKNSKIQRLVDGVKEERQMQNIYIEEQRARADLAEERADQLESKLMSLVEYIKNLPPPSTQNNQSNSNKKEAEELKNRAEAAEEEQLRLNAQVGKLEGSLHQLQIQLEESNALQAQLRNELIDEVNRRTEGERQISMLNLQKMEVNALEERLKETQDELYRVNFQLSETERNLQSQVRNTEAEREKTKRISVGINPKVLEAEMKAEAMREEMEERISKMVKILSTAKVERQRLQDELDSITNKNAEFEMQSESIANHNKQLQEELKKLQISSEEAKSKAQSVASLESALEQKGMRVEAMERQIQKLETSLANQQSKFKSSDDSAWTKIEELENELEKMKSKNNLLSHDLSSLQSKLNSNSVNPTVEVQEDESSEPSEESGGPPPPPPPGPPPPPPLAKASGPLKIVKKAKPAGAPGKAEETPATPAAPAAPNIVDELKKGTFTLRKVTPVPKKPIEPKPEAAGFAAIAFELTKQRQARLQQQSQRQTDVRNARKSVKLTNVLSELGGF